MKTYPLEVCYLADYEGDGSIVCYYSKGHHSPVAFAAETLKEHEIVIDQAKVIHKYMRWEMATGPHGPYQVGAEHPEPGRGKFPITICYSWSKPEKTTSIPSIVKIEMAGGGLGTGLFK